LDWFFQKPAKNLFLFYFYFCFFSTSQRLRDNDILAALIWSESYQTDFGFVDLLDVCALLVDHSTTLKSHPESFAKTFFGTPVEQLG
jgi:hypothetical protein